MPRVMEQLLIRLIIKKNPQQQQICAIVIRAAWSLVFGDYTHAQTE